MIPEEPVLRRVWSRGFSLFVVAAAIVPAGVAAQEGPPPPPPAAEYRASLMTSLQSHMRALSALVEGDVAYMGHLQMHATAIHAIATMTGEAFPEGTAEGSRASEDIWTNWDAFTEKVRMLQDGAAALDAAAQAGDRAGVEAARSEVQASCRSCHTDFRLSPRRD